MSTDVASKTNNPGMEVTIHTPSGDVKLNPLIVRRYLVNGDGPVSEQEIAMFLGLCKYQNLNPFLREAYLIKYGQQPATIVTAKEVFLKRAYRSDDFHGHKAGIICQAPEQSELVYTQGICPPGSKIVGGWAEVHKDGWTFPLRVEVDFAEYVGKKKDGTTNRMWSEKPATMIRKVALVQALREAFPDTYQGMYSEEEIETEGLPRETIDPEQVIDVSAEQGEKPEPQTERRRRANKFAGLDKAVFGTTELNTCGATPDQLLELRGYMREDERVADMVQRKLEGIGYSELSYLRQDEAEELIDLLRPAGTEPDPPQGMQPIGNSDATNGDNAPDDLVDCPLRPGDRLSVSQYCKTICQERKAAGFCIAIGENPPEKGGML